MKFAVIGGDMRIVRLAAMLEGEGHEICCFALDEAPADLIKSCSLSVDCSAKDADCVILPLPVLDMKGGLNAPLSSFKHNAEEIFRALPKTAVICGGMPGEKLRKTAEELGLDFVDYFLREELVALNALATAEGALGVRRGNAGDEGVRPRHGVRRQHASGRRGTRAGVRRQSSGRGVGDGGSERGGRRRDRAGHGRRRADRGNLQRKTLYPALPSG